MDDRPISPTLDAIVIGSGPGGSAVARELTRLGKRVAVLEQGGTAPLKGTLTQMASIAALPGRGAFLQRDGSLLVQGTAAGGSSTVFFATATPPPLEMFAAFGVDLAPSLAALRAELPMGPLPDELMGPMAARIMEGAIRLGLDWRKLDKLIRPQVCRNGCWRCAYGCPYGAKWTARDFLDEAVAGGAILLDRAHVTRILIENGRAAGVAYERAGIRATLEAGTIILAAGGIGSPRLLQASGLQKAKSPFFSDPVVAVMGIAEDIDGGAEVPMAAGLALSDEGITLADMTLPAPMYMAFALQAGRPDRLFSHRRALSVMVKIRDDIGGAVSRQSVSKRLTASDRAKFKHGIALASDVLKAAGAKRLFQTYHFAAHPGGSVRIGDGVDGDLQTAVHGLFVCDASVIPRPWGLPPTLTLLCLGKRLGTHLAG